MTERAPIDVKNLDRYGNPALPWSRPRDLLANPPSRGEPGGDSPSFLGTSRPDGRPHAAGIGALWHEGDFYFTSGPETRKSRNILANTACTISMSLEGIDLVVEGDATRVIDRPTLAALAAKYRDRGWPVDVEGDAFAAPFSAPSAGPPPWHLFRVRIHTAIGVATAEPDGATRWRFDP